MARLTCRRCGYQESIGFHVNGCPQCLRNGRRGIFEVTYNYDAAAQEALARALRRSRVHSIWRFESLLPASGRDVEVVTLGEGGTPLIEANWLPASDAVGRLFLKNETANPTWCSKDRGNAVSATMGRLLGAPGMVATTTGNHGTSLAAYCGLASIPAIAVMSVHSDVIHRAMTAMYGGLAVVSTRPEALLQHLVHECGWYPATSLDGSAAANPFGVEGYKTIAYELFEDLDGVPDAVLVPAASGDLVYGVYKGFHELRELGFASAVPRMIACQAEGAAPLARAMHEELEEVPVLAAPATVAISIGDATSGAPALEAVKRSAGHVVTVSDEQILASQQQLAAHGLLVETASAAAVAASSAGAKAGLFSDRDRIVCLLTGSGAKWSTQLLSSVAPRVLLEPSEATMSEVARKLGRSG